MPSPEELSVTAPRRDPPGHGEPALMTAAGQWQVRFDGGHQQRYLVGRAAMLRYVLAVAPYAASTRFEVYAEAEPVRLADGSPGGRQFALAEVIDFAQPGEADRLRAELAELQGRSP
ncbi:MAG TPA: hypothetical protein VMC83_41480 [Streptosporangiaceae bacterium]|nr:hypothetical protein [Streptosporangiaceae bacterium]